jgi:hypothetical protein
VSVRPVESRVSLPDGDERRSCHPAKVMVIRRVR